MTQAHGLAIGEIYGSVQRQAANLAYDYIFVWIGIMFALCVPVAFLMKGASNKTAAAPAPVHVD
jgi:hypothetical protein